MAQQVVDSLRTNTPSQSPSQATPTLGLRGGLGKTLLIAFLLLAIVPLSLLSFVTYNQIQHDTGRRLEASLQSIVALKADHLLDWVASYERELALLAEAPLLQSGTDIQRADLLAERLALLQGADPSLAALAFIDREEGGVTAVPASAQAALRALDLDLLEEHRLALAPRTRAQGGASDPAPVLAISHDGPGGRLVALLKWESLQALITASDGQDAGITTWLATADGLMASSDGVKPLALDGGQMPSQGVARALEGQNGSGMYNDLAGTPVFGAYRWLPELQVALLAEHSQSEALASGNTVTAMIVGATLAVALITAASAAFVTRRLTRPIVQLTETAAWMARGDLNQKVRISSQDEIGVLARAFNRMAAELRVLYSELEDKVAERTRQLEDAHERTRYYVMQLSISAEVARVASSIRDLDELLTTVVQLVGNSFELHRVSIYLLDSSGQRATWQAGNNGYAAVEEEIVGGPTLVGQVAADGHRRVLRPCSETSAAQEPALSQPTCEMAVPLRSRQKVLGVLHLQSNKGAGFDANDEMVYQSLADQLGIAIENVRAYALERETVQRLKELDQIQSQFLSNMSHALRTPLNSVIGFSRLMLRELDGPLSDLQRTDLTTIYDSGRQLLGLINDMLELTQLELGTASFSLSEIDLAEIVDGVMATARALALSKPVQLYQQVPADLPPICTDGQRVRQVILALLSNAVKYTDRGSIHLNVVRDDGRVIISVRDTGIGIPPEERNHIFADPQHDGSDGKTATPGFGLAISRRVVERLGGQIWVESEAGVGSVFTFTLPLQSPEVGEDSAGNGPTAGPMPE